jgi:hypothetical protein
MDLNSDAMPWDERFGIVASTSSGMLNNITELKPFQISSGLAASCYFATEARSRRNHLDELQYPQQTTPEQVRYQEINAPGYHTTGAAT